MRVYPKNPNAKPTDTDYEFSCVAQVMDGVATIMGLPKCPPGTRTTVNEELIRHGCTSVGGLRRRKGRPPKPVYFDLIPRAVRHEEAA